MNPTLRRVAWLCAALVSGCQAGLDVPDGAHVTCTSNAQCPRGFECRSSLGACARSGNAAPSVTISPIARGTDSVQLVVRVYDDESDEVTLAATLEHAGASASMTLAGATVASSSAGSVATLTWDAAQHFGSSGYRPSLVIRLTPSDGNSAGATVTSEPFDFGNDSPTLGGVSVGASVAGIAVVSFVPQDVPDAVDLIRFELSVRGDFTDTISLVPSEHAGAGRAFPAGDILAIEADGFAHTLVWDSRLTSAVSAPSAVLRLTISDGMAEVSASSPPFELKNQTAPGVLDLRAHSGGDSSVANFVPITYRVFDAESDDVDVAIDVSADGGTTWQPAIEAPSPLSEGRAQLATRPLGGADGGGISHAFVWDVLANLKAFQGAVFIRVSVADDHGGGSPAELLVPDVGIPGYEPIVKGSWVQAIFNTAIATGDLDQDGDIDLAYVSSAASDNITTVDNRGDGYFDGRPSALATGCWALTASIATVDAGADPDLVLGCASVHEVQVLPGTSGIGFGAAQTYDVDGWVQAMVVVDLEGDGDRDIVLGPQDGLAAVDDPLGVLLNNGSGFDPIATYALPPLVEGITIAHLAVGDVDGDGELDVAGTYYAPYYGEQTLFVWLGDGAGGLGAPSSHVVSRVAGLAIVDLNADGLDDLIVLSAADRLVAVHVANGSVGNPSFSEPELLPLGFAPKDLELGDLDGDGRVDLAIGAQLDVHALLSRTWDEPMGAVFAPAVHWAKLPSVHDDLAVAELNGDGIADFAYAAQFLGTPQVQLSRNRPWEIPPWSYGAENVASLALHNGLQAADFERDGIVDLIAFARDTGVVTRWRGRGHSGVAEARFDAFATLTGLTVPSAIDVCDLDADRVPDLLVRTEPTTYDTRLFLSASGAFVPAAPLAAAPVTQAHCDDVNTDGDLDLLLAVRTADEVRLLLGDGAGEFASTIVAGPSALTRPTAAYSGDFDGDGVLDLVVMAGSPVLSVVWREANGALGAPQEVVVGGSLASVLVLDVDRDGADDLVVVGWFQPPESMFQDGGVRVFRGDKQRGFVAQDPFFTYTTPSARVADVNMDMVPDLLLFGEDRSAMLGLAEPDAYGGWFGYPRRLDEDTDELAKATDAVIADLSGDGVADVAYTRSQGSVSGVVAHRLGRRADPSQLAAWSLSPWDESDSGGVHAAAFGDATLEPASALNRAAAPAMPTLWRRRAGVASAGGSLPWRAGTFLDGLRRSALAPLADLTPLTDAWDMAGDLRLTRVVTSTGELRLQIDHRFGPNLPSGRRAGLDLAASNVASQRGLIVDLPFINGRTATPAAIRVFMCGRDHLRAFEDPSDALFEAQGVDDLLPKATDGRDVIVSRCVWDEVARDADSSLATGTGRRFVVDTARGAVRVLTDRLGIFQAFAQ